MTKDSSQSHSRSRSRSPSRDRHRSDSRSPPSSLRRSPRHHQPHYSPSGAQHHHQQHTISSSSSSSDGRNDTPATGRRGGDAERDRGGEESKDQQQRHSPQSLTSRGGSSRRGGYISDASPNADDESQSPSGRIPSLSSGTSLLRQDVARDRKYEDKHGAAVERLGAEGTAALYAGDEDGGEEVGEVSKLMRRPLQQQHYDKLQGAAASSHAQVGSPTEDDDIFNT